LVFQDPLSALDAHVGRAVFQNVLQDRSSGKTRILVTHALHFLSQVDYIYTVVDGHIAERGTYTELMANDGEFSKFITEFGSKEEENENESDGSREEKTGGPDKKAVAGAGIMQAEERNTGAVTWDIYRSYISAGKGILVIPLLLVALVLSEGATVMGSYWYVFLLLLNLQAQLEFCSTRLVYWQEK
jgi:ABC-type multidrug transport system ATPase subunit